MNAVVIAAVLALLCALLPPSHSQPWTPKFGLEMQLSDGALTYVSATRGFKSGGWTLASVRR